MNVPALPQKDQPITFPNGNQAEVVRVPSKTNPVDILAALGATEPAPVVVVTGTTAPLGPKLHNRLKELFSRGVARAALEAGALIVDGGTQAGVIELMGQGVADRGRKTPLIGVAPESMAILPDAVLTDAPRDAARLDPNHSHFVLVDSDRWGGEVDTIYKLAQAASGGDEPVVNILAGGNPEGVSVEEALSAVRHGWPLVIIEGSGRLADRLAALYRQKTAAARRSGGGWNIVKRIPGFGGLAELRIGDPALSEILHDGNLILFPPNGTAAQLRDFLHGLLVPPTSRVEDLLNLAWKRFAEYDRNSTRHRDAWHRLKNMPLQLGVLTTLLVLVYSTNNAEIIAEGQSSLWINSYNAFMRFLSGIQDNALLDLIFRFLIILLPISISIMMGIETRFKLGSKYILLRGAAEAVKRGIYSYRALSSNTSVPPGQLPNTLEALASHLERVSKILLESDVNEAAFRPYEGKIPPSMYGAEAYDDGRSRLNPRQYVRIRVGDQIKFFILRTNQYEERLRRLQVWILVLGGLGTFLAAIGAQYWLPLSAAIVSAMTAFLEYRQIEPILVKYNLTKSSLENINSWWEGLPAEEQKKEENIANLVRETEAILESENQGWVQYVKQAQETQKMTAPEETVVEEAPDGG